MNRILLSLFFFFMWMTSTFSMDKNDSLLRVLDQTILKRKEYTLEKEAKIDSIKRELTQTSSVMERFQLNNAIAAEYQSFKCDSALVYVDRNIDLAKTLGNEELLYQSRLNKAFVLSLSGLFTPALEILESIDYQKLPSYLQIFYCWSFIRYHENLIKYIDNPDFEKAYLKEINKHRKTLMMLMGKGSAMYAKEEAFQLKAEGEYVKAAALQQELFENEKPHSHGYAMAAMGLATTFKKLGRVELEEKYLIISAITDIQLAVKENESLLALAIYQYEKGDVDRAFNYIQASLEDANFYNSRFKNAVIARIHPIIEATYLAKIEEQKQNLRSYALTISVIVLVLILTLYFLYKQIKNVSKARKNLKCINEQLNLVNHKLDEANLIRERYIGYYINQCAIYLDKLEEYRKYVYRKLKAGQVADLQKMSSTSEVFARETEARYRDFDKTFCEIYPNFVDEFNNLLKEDQQYLLNKNELNTELRIFALIRLGISDVNQIATFLRYSIQTIYNYKSKVKGKVQSDSDFFEEKVKRIGNISPD